METLIKLYILTGLTFSYFWFLRKVSDIGTADVIFAAVLVALWPLPAIYEVRALWNR